MEGRHDRLPLQIDDYGPVTAFGGAFANLGPVVKAPVRINSAVPERSKLQPSIRAAIEACGLRDGGVISFHHHLRNGDSVLNSVLDEIARMGLRNIRIAPSSLFPVHAPLVEHIRSGVVTRHRDRLHGGPRGRRRVARSACHARRHVHARRQGAGDRSRRTAHRRRVHRRADRRRLRQRQRGRGACGLRLARLRGGRCAVRRARRRDHRQPRALPRVPGRHPAGPRRLRRARRFDRRSARHRLGHHARDDGPGRSADRADGGAGHRRFGAPDRRLLVPDRRRRHLARGRFRRARAHAGARRAGQLRLRRYHRLHRRHARGGPLPRAVRRSVLRPAARSIRIDAIGRTWGCRRRCTRIRTTRARSSISSMR